MDGHNRGGSMEMLAGSTLTPEGSLEEGLVATEDIATQRPGVLGELWVIQNQSL
jgi:hypothetical protein